MLKILLVTLTLCFSTNVLAAEGDRYNFRVDPTDLLFQTFTMDVDRKISDKWTLGIDIMQSVRQISAYDAGTAKDIATESIGAGFFGQWFENGVYKDGRFLKPSISYAHHKHSMKDSMDVTRHGAADIVYASAAIGRGWFWETFNIMFDVSVSVPIGNSKVYINYPNGNRTETNRASKNLAANFMLGWTF